MAVTRCSHLPSYPPAHPFCYQRGHTTGRLHGSLAILMLALVARRRAGRLPTMCPPRARARATAPPKGHPLPAPACLPCRLSKTAARPSDGGTAFAGCDSIRRICIVGRVASVSKHATYRGQQAPGQWAPLSRRAARLAGPWPCRIQRAAITIDWADRLMSPVTPPQ